MYEITGLEQKWPNNFEDALHNDHFEKTLVKFFTSTWDETKYLTVFTHKAICLNCEDIYFRYHVEKGKLTKTEDTWLRCNHEEADIKMLFHVGHSISK